MFQSFQKFVKFSSVVLFFTISSAFSLRAQGYQQSDEVEVPIIQQFGSKSYGCYMENGIIDEQTLKKLNADRRCANLYLLQNTDFAKQTLIGYRAGGDCFLRVSARVFRNDKTKKYTIRIRNVWGGCRAGDSFQGWLTIEKIPPGYAAEFVETKASKYDAQDTEDVLNLNSLPARKINSVSAPEILETRFFEMKNCIQVYRQNQYVIKEEKTYLKAIRNDASRERCLKDLEKIDFGRHTLLGIEINSGYCQTPLGLDYQTIKDKAKKRYILDISYLEPRYGGCRALSQYDLWVLVPKLPGDYEVGFEVTAKPAVNNQ